MLESLSRVIIHAPHIPLLRHLALRCQTSAMTHSHAFEQSLETVASHCEDPVPLVYAQIFEHYPEMEALFILDTDHGARGHMLNEALSCAQDLLGPDTFATSFIAAERQNHEGYAITDDIFEAFFTTMHSVFRGLSNGEWTPAMDAAWQAVFEKVAAARL